MPHKEDVLLELGLSKNEARVYLKLLLLGQGTGGQIADASEVYRANTYHALDRLVGKGLVRYITTNNVKVFEATNPTALKSLLDQKQTLLDDVLPEFEEMYQEITKKNKDTVISVHEGVKSIRAILYNLLTYEQPIYVTGVPAKAPHLMRHFIEAFHKERIRKKIPMLHIYNEDGEDRVAYLNNMKHTEAKQLPRNFDSPTSFLICGEETILVMWHITPLTHLRIRDKLTADSYKNYFEILWEKAQ